MKSRMTGFEGLTLALVLLGMAGIATAAATETRRVAVADLDLQSAAGLDTLYMRLQGAAREVCGLGVARGYAGRQRARRCVDATLDATLDAASTAAGISRTAISHGKTASRLLFASIQDGSGSTPRAASSASSPGGATR